MKHKILIAVFFLMILLAIGQVCALGITPGRTSVDYSVGVSSRSVTIINSDHKDLDLKITTRGDMASYIKLNEDSISMKANEDSRQIDFDLNIPDGLSPGEHIGEVVVIENNNQASSASASVGASLGVATQVAVFVPYPGKYVESDLRVDGDEKEKNFVVSLTNRGQDKLDKVSADIVIYDVSGKEVTRLKTNEVSLNVNEAKEITAKWEVNVGSGKYTAKAAVHYDGSDVLAEKDFEVGQSVLDLKKLFVENFKLGQIAKFNMVVENKWSEPINGAYAEMRVYDNKMNELGDVKSATYDIPPGMQTTMEYYWDTKDISVGTYDSNIILTYGDQKTQQDLKLEVGQSSINVIGLGYVISADTSSGGSSMTVILFVVIGLLVLLNLAWFFVFRKMIKKKGSNSSDARNH